MSIFVGTLPCLPNHPGDEMRSSLNRFRYIWKVPFKRQFLFNTYMVPLVNQKTWWLPGFERLWCAVDPLILYKNVGEGVEEYEQVVEKGEF